MSYYHGLVRELAVPVMWKETKRILLLRQDTHKRMGTVTRSDYEIVVCTSFNTFRVAVLKTSNETPLHPGFQVITVMTG